jgi:uncharacterized membrane protein
MKAVPALLTFAYPFLIYLGLERLGPRRLALLVAALLAVRGLWLLRGRPIRELRAFVLPALIVGALVGAAAWLDDARLILALPVAINGVLLVAFARTLRRGPSMIERFARLQRSDLSDEEMRYCRSVTVVWCAFFVLNGAVAAALAAFGSLAAWTLYTGAISYVLMGILFAAEFIVRAWRFRHYRGAFTDPLLRRIFPPRPAA